MIFSKKTVTCMTILLALTSLVNGAYARSDEKRKHDPLVGSFAVNITIGGEEVYAIWSFEEDGSIVFADTLGLQQPLPPLAPAGLYGSISLGKWKKVCKRSYTFVQDNVLNLKDTGTRNDCGDLLLAGIPFARGKGTGTIELSDDYQFINATATLIFYEIDDISLTKVKTINGQPLPPVTATLVGQRLK